jgi:hypothetical protein
VALNVLNLTAILGFETKGADSAVAGAEKVQKSVRDIAAVQQEAVVASEKSSAKLVQLQARYKEAVEAVQEFDKVVAEQTKKVKASGVSLEDARKRLVSLVAVVDNNNQAYRELRNESIDLAQAVSALNLELKTSKDLTDDERKAKEAELKVGKERLELIDEELGKLKQYNKETEDQISQTQELVTISSALEKSDRTRIDLMANVETTSRAVSREQTRLNTALAKSAPIFNASAGQLSQWIQLIRTGNVTQGLFTQGISKLSALLQKLPFIGVAAAGVFSALSFALYQAWKQAEALRKEFEAMDQRIRGMTGLAIDLTDVWGDVAAEFGFSGRELNRTAAEFAQQAAGIGIAAHTITDTVKELNRAAAQVADTLGVDVAEAQAAMSQALEGSVGAWNKLTGEVLSSSAITDEALRMTGKVYADTLTAAEIYAAGVAVLGETSATSTVNSERARQQALLETAKSYLQLLATAMATAAALGESNMAAPSDIAAAAFEDLFSELGMDVAIDTAEDLQEALQDVINLIERDLSASILQQRWEGVAGIAKEAEDKQKAAAQVLASQGGRVLEDLTKIAELQQAVSEGGGPEAEWALVRAVREFQELGPNTVTVLNDIIEAEVEGGKVSQELADYLYAARDAAEALGGDLPEEALLAFAEAAGTAATETERLTSVGYSAIDSFRNLADAMARAEAESNPENTLAVARAWEQVLNIAGDVEGGLAAVVQQLDYLQQVGYISAAAADAARAAIGSLDGIVRVAGDSMSGTGANAYYMAGGFGTAALKGAELAAALAAIGVATNLLPGGPGDPEYQAIGNRLLFADQLKKIKDAIGTFTSGFGSAFSSVGSSASGAADEVETAADRMLKAINAAIAAIDAELAIGTAKDELAELQEIAANLPQDIIDANERWLESIDALAEAEARLTEEQQKSLMVTAQEQAAIEDLQDKVWLAEKAYRQGTISAAKLQAIKDELAKAEEDSTAPTREEDQARRDVERAQKETEAAAEYMNELKDRQLTIALEIERAELRILQTILQQEAAAKAANDARIAAGGTIGLPGVGGGVGGVVGGVPDTYTVRPGDTLSQIAAMFGFPDWQTLHAQNPQISNPNLIHPGRVINVTVSALWPGDPAMQEATAKAIQESIVASELAGS